MAEELKFDQAKFDEQMKAVQSRHDGLEKAIKDAKDASAAELKSLKDTLDNLKSELNSMEPKAVDGSVLSIQKMQKQNNDLEKRIKELETHKGIKPETLQDKIITLVKSADFVNAIKTGQQTTFILEKAANDLLTSDWTADTGTVGLPQMNIPGVTKWPWKAFPVYNSVVKRAVGYDHEIRYTEELTRSDAAARKAEGSQYAQSGATWIAKKLGFEDVGHYIKSTREDLEDAEYVRDEINDLLYNGLLRALEYKLVNGTGSSDISGLYGAYAKTFAKTVGLAGVSGADIDDVLAAAKLQVRKGYNYDAANDANKTGYMANLALIGPATMANVSMLKDDIGRKLYDINSWRPAGMSVLESEDLTEDGTNQYFLVGDFSKATLYMKRNIIIETGLDGNDFTYGMITLRASVRCNLLVKSKETYAFVKGDFATAPQLIA